MGITSLAVRMSVKNRKIESYNRFLFIGPHPDDIEIGAGATVSKLCAMGKQVTFLICTDGRFGKENLDSPVSTDSLIAMRKEESIASAKLLGVEDVRFLDLTDGNGYSVRELACGIADTILDVRPDLIFAPDPDVESECHADHLNVGRICKELANFANYSEIFAQYTSSTISETNSLKVDAICLYMTAKPNAYVKTGKHFKKQLAAILVHASQYPKEHPATASVFLYLKLRSAEFGLRKFSLHAEGFRMLNQTMMHCLPEVALR